MIDIYIIHIYVSCPGGAHLPGGAAVAPRGRGVRGLGLRVSRVPALDEGDRVRGLHRLQPQQVAHGPLRLHRHVVRN